MGLQRLFRVLQLLLCALIATLAGVALDAGEDHPERTALQPGKPMDYHDLAFYPERWQQAQVSTRLIPWEGRNVVFLTTTNQFDAEVMGRFVGRLDAGWKLYAELTGRSPQPFRQRDGKPTIAAVPDAALTCGYGCGYVGATGMEIGGFYDGDYPLAKRDPEAFAHYYFYEMGRNYYTFGDRHSLFITGYAVFMRYVCMDALHCTDPDRSTRQTIETCESLYASSDCAIPHRLHQSVRRREGPSAHGPPRTAGGPQ